MGADVAAATRAASHLRIGAPDGLLDAGGFDFGGQPALQVIGIDPADFPQQTAAGDVTGKTAGPMTEVSVGDAEWDVAGLDGFDQGGGFLEIDCEGILAKYGDARLDDLHDAVEDSDAGIADRVGVKAC